MVSGLSVVVQVRGTGFYRSRSSHRRRRDAHYVNGIRRRRSVRHGLPVPFSRFRESLGGLSHLMRGSVRGNLEISIRNRRRRRIPVERVQRGEIVGRRIGQAVVQVYACRRGERIPLARCVGSKRRDRSSAREIEPVTAGSIQSSELLRTPGSGRRVGFSEGRGVESLSVNEIHGGNESVVIDRTVPSDGIGQRGRIPIRSQSKGGIRAGKNDGQPFSVDVYAGAVRSRSVIGIPSDHDMVERRRITERSAARIGIVRIPGQKDLVRGVQSEFGSRAHSSERAEEFLRGAEFGTFRPKTHRPSSEASSCRRSFAQISALGGIEAYGIGHCVRSRNRSRRARSKRLFGIHQSSGRRLGRIPNQSERSARGTGQSGNVSDDVRRTAGKEGGSLENRAQSGRGRSVDGRIGHVDDAYQDRFGIVGRGCGIGKTERGRGNLEFRRIELQCQPIRISGGVIRSRNVPSPSGEIYLLSGEFNESPRQGNSGEG